LKLENKILHMRKIVFDIETQNFFEDVGARDPALLDISLLAIYDSETDQYYSFLHSELDKLWPYLERADVLIGFNSIHFDMPLLNKYYAGDLSKIHHVDLMQEIKKSLGRRIGLDAVTKSTLGVGKSGHGVQGVTWWRNGEIEKLREYCIQDVRVTKDLYEYILKNGHVKIKDGETTKEIQIDTSEWEKKDEGGITKSLDF